MCRVHGELIKFKYIFDQQIYLTMAKQLKRFCKITQYIEKTDTKLYEIFDDLCVWGQFRTRRGHAGVTFIWPSKETISELDKVRYTEDIMKGYDTVMAHIVTDYLPTAAAWNSKKSDIPTQLNKKLEVKEVKGSKVILADGAELELDPKFKSFQRGEPTQAVWRVTKGSINPAKQTKPASFEHARRGDRPVGKRPQEADGGAVDANVLRQHLEKLVMAVKSKTKADSNDLFAELGDFLNYVSKNGTDADKKHVSYIASPLPISSYAFLTSDKSCLKDLWTAFNEDGKAKSGLFGYRYYLNKVRELRNAQGIVGGNLTRAKLVENLNRAIAESIEGTKKWLESAGVTGIEPRFMVNLNLARMSECEMFNELVKNSTLSASDLAEIIKEISDNIIDLAEDKGFATNNDTQKLGILVSSIFNHIAGFVSSKYFQYPYAKAAEVDAPVIKLLEEIYVDTSAHAKISSASGEHSAELYSNIDNRPTESVETAPTDEAKTGDDAETME